MRSRARARPNSRTPAALVELATKWITTDGAQLVGLAATMVRVERELSIGGCARDAVLRFAGEKHLATRP